MLQASPTPDAWKGEILDFLAWRANTIFTDWTPRSAPVLARLLSGRDWETIIAANVLASPNFRCDIVELTRLAPREMEQARLESIGAARGRVRGRVLASRTVVERVRRADPTIWVTARTDKVWQTEPNRFTAGFLSYLLRASSAVLDHVADTATSPIVAGVEAVDRALRSEPLRRVDPDPNWGGRDLPAALIAKSRFYRIADTWARSIRDARRTRTANDLRQVLLGGWLASEDDERLLEVYALSRVLAALHASDTWDNFKLTAGVRTGGGTSIQAAAGPVVVEVRFDRTPPIAGQYAWLLARYRDLDGRGRRPDLQIITIAQAVTLTTFVEVKATTPNTQYGRDSIVKVFGYLKDFAELWAGETACQYPRAVLLYTCDVHPNVDRGDRVFADEVLLADTFSFDLDISAVIARHRQLLGLPLHGQ